MKVLLAVYAATAVILPGVVESCDEFSWEEVQLQHQECLENQGYFFHTLESSFTSTGMSGRENLCRLIRVIQECAYPLSLCEDSHQLETELLLAKELPSDWEDLSAHCFDEFAPPTIARSDRHKRAAKKKGGSRGSVRSRASSAIRRVASTIGRNRGGGGGHRSGGGRLSSVLGGNRGRAAAGAAAKKSKGKTLRKVGKYAVAGLAAYGTYKLAKKMSKGLRAEYDDDDCWEYNVFTGEYNCECDNCNVYVGSAVLASSSGLMLTVVSAVFSFYYHRFCSAW